MIAARVILENSDELNSNGIAKTQRIQTQSLDVTLTESIFMPVLPRVEN